MLEQLRLTQVKWASHFVGGDISVALCSDIWLERSDVPKRDDADTPLEKPV